MKRKHFGGIIVAFFALGSLALAQGPMGGMGQIFGPETDEWMNHVPTLDSMSKTRQAGQNLADLLDEHPELKEEAELDMTAALGRGRGRGTAGMPQIPTLDDMVASMQSYPQAVSAVESAGLSVRDFFKNTLSLSVGWAMFQMDKQGALGQIKQMMPSFRTPASLDFIRANETDVQIFVDTMQRMGE